MRTLLLPKVFTTRELSALDELTANSEIVLASLGGAPKSLVDSTNEPDKKKEVETEKQYEERKKGAPRQRIGDIRR